MTIPSKIKSCFEQLLSEVYARRLREDNQKVCIDCLKPRSNTNKFECKKCDCTEFYVLIIKILHLKYCPFVMYKMTVFSKTKPHSDAVDYFKELPFYNKPIIKPKVKHLKSIDRLAELPFYEQLIVRKTNQAFGGYAMSYKVEITERKDPIVQLEASKSSIKDLLNDLLNETKGFKYQIAVKKIQKKTSPMEKLNLLQFILIHLQKQ